MNGARMVAQAKINLFLRILAREASGFHSLETLFQRLDLGDLVSVRLNVAGRSLDCDDADAGPTERNLAWRAAVEYADATGWPSSFAIEVEKRIPVGAGLGGGSADAGAVLRLLDHLSPEPIGQQRLLQLAVRLGADVPFLTSTAVRALAWGRGERLLALPALRSMPVALLIPSQRVATVEAFGWLAAARATHSDDHPGPIPQSRQLYLSDLGDWKSLEAVAGNDFEGPVALHSSSVAALAGLRNGLRVLPGERDPLIYEMTGSGSTWFVLSPSSHALDASERLAGNLPGMTPVRTQTSQHVVEPQPIE